MRDNKGFTLIELLMTISLLILVIGLVYQLFTKQLATSKTSAYNRQISTIKQVAKDYHLQNINDPYVRIEDLNSIGMIDSEDLIDPRDGSIITGCIIFNKNTTYNQYEYIYEKDLERCSDRVRIITSDVVIDIHDTFDAMSGVSALDKDGNDITDRVSIIENNFIEGKIGQYVIKYGIVGSTVIKLRKIDVLDLIKPTLTVSPSSETYGESGNVTITVSDNEGGTGLASMNVYKYCLSTSNTTRENCEWTPYTSGTSFAINGTNQTKYLWVWPIKDNGGNINGDYANVNTPYVAGIYKFISTYTITYNLNEGTATNNTSYNIETETFTLNNPTRLGYIFTGWTGSNGETPSTSVSITKGSTGNKTYTANWAPSIYDFAYTGAVQTFTAPVTGYYQIEAWGASGGTSRSNGSISQTSGNGAYTSGIITLSKGEELKIYVGEKGADAVVGKNSVGGYNGGGLGTWDNSDDESAGGGGGSTDIRYFGSYTPSSEELLWNSELGFNSRIMVASGGGGGAWTSKGGSGGTLVGLSNNPNAGGGTQVNGYSFGIGQNGSGTGDSDGVGGAGSGYYGGYSSGSTSAKESGASGSSFISGYAGVNAITSASTRTHTNNTIHYSGKYFINGTMQGGVNSGNGRAKITYLGSESTRTNTKLNNVRYIKDCINGSSASNYNSWVELQAIHQGHNIAKSKTVVGTEAEKDITPYSNIVDGRIDNITGSSGYGQPISNGKLHCITVDLGSTYNLDEIAVWHYYMDGRTFNSNVTSVSSDNTNWVEVINKTESETSNGKRVSAYSS